MLRIAPQIETDRLRLNGHQPGDFEAVAAMWSDPDVVRFIGGRPSTREESWARLLRYAGSWAMLGQGFWTFRDKASGAYLGEGGLLKGQRSVGAEFDETSEVGWALTPSAQGHGYASEAVGAILDWADAQGIYRTVCLIEPSNGASIRLAERLGFQQYDSTVYHGAQVNLYERSVTR